MFTRHPYYLGLIVKLTWLVVLILLQLYDVSNTWTVFWTAMGLLFLFLPMHRITDDDPLTSITQVPDPLLIVNSRGTIVRANDVAVNVLGDEKHSLIGQKIERFIPSQFAHSHAKLRDLFFKSDGRVQMRNAVTMVTATGQAIACEVNLSLFNHLDKKFAIVLIRTIEDFVSQKKQLEASEKRYRDTFDKCAVGMAHVSLSGSFMRVNRQLCRLLGYKEQELLNLTFQYLTHPDDIKTDLNHVDELLEGRSDTYTMDKRYRCKDGEYVWGKLTVALVRNELGDPEYFISVIEDIEQQKVATSLLYQSEKKFRSIVDQLSKEMVVWMSTPGVKEMLYVNDGYENIWGRSSSSLYERPQSFIDLVHPEDKQRVVEHLVSHAEGNWDVNYRIVRDDGEVRYIHDVGFGILDENQTLNFLIGTALDRTNDEKMQLSLKQTHADLMQAHEELKKASIVDPLTKAFNRGELQRIAEEEIRRFVRGEYNSTLVILDLNDFKEINDNFGHNIGDKALQNFAEHLRKHFRELDKLGRFGGDEFVMILPNTNEEQANILINRLSQKLVNVRVNESQNIPVDCSIGFAHLTEKLVDFDSWIAEADQRMYVDKRSQKEME